MLPLSPRRLYSKPGVTLLAVPGRRSFLKFMDSKPLARDARDGIKQIHIYIYIYIYQDSRLGVHSKGSWL